jgi:dTMP kinase
MSTQIGQFIVIEGLDGAGKSTAVQTVVDVLSGFNIPSVVTREPGGTTIGEQLRSIIINPEYKNILDDKSELLLFYAARIQLLEQVIKPALNKGFWVVTDRFELSTLAYQGGGRGLCLDWIHKLSAFCLNGFKPSLTLYLDIPPAVGLERIRSRGHYDRIEQQSIDFFQKIHAVYKQQAETYPDIKTVDARCELTQVTQIIQDIMFEFIESLV